MHIVFSQSANASEIKKAFRRLSLQLHPDKNPAEDAELQFRKVLWKRQEMPRFLS